MNCRKKIIILKDFLNNELENLASLANLNMLVRAICSRLLFLILPKQKWKAAGTKAGENSSKWKESYHLL